MDTYERRYKYKSFNLDASDVKILRLFKGDDAYVLTVTDSNDDLVEVRQYRFEEAAYADMVNIIFKRQFKGWKSEEDIQDTLIPFIMNNDWDRAKGQLAMVLWYRNENFGEKGIDVGKFMDSND